jgi:hypothetical protein
MVAAMLCALTSAWNDAAYASTATREPAGFVPLFNGRNLDGWVVAGDAAGFRVANGCIRSDGGKGGQWIHTARPYANFVLRLEWMLSRVGNSGIIIRNGASGGGFEVQLLAPWTPHRDDLHCTGSIYGHVPANPRPDETPLRWRTAEITAAYEHITVRIDGIVCAQADYDRVATMKDMPLAGFVGMQDSHTGAGEWVKFRNIEIRDLDQDPSFVTQGLASSDSAVRRAAYDAAVRLGAPMAQLLLDMIGRGDARARHIAQAALERVVANASAPGGSRPAWAAVRRDLLDRLRATGDNEAPDRALAARMIGLIGLADARTVEALRKALLEGGDVAAAALEAMQRIPGHAMTAALIDALPQVRVTQQPAIVLALGARRDETGLALLGEMARTRGGLVRLAAVQALGLLGSARAIPALRDIGTTAPEPVRKEAADALIGLADEPGLTSSARAEALAAARELAGRRRSGPAAQKAATTGTGTGT